LPDNFAHWLSSPSRAASCSIIAEVAQAHDGSLGMAHAFIDAIAGAGAHAVKFQTHIAAAESTPAEPWRTKFGTQDETRFDYWRRMEFSESQWLELKRHAEEKGLLFLSSPFSLEALVLLERIGVVAWKVASGEVSNLDMITRMAETALPIILSSGLSDYAELDQAVSIARGGVGALAVMQCTTRYPTPPEQIGLNVLGELAKRYPDAAVGLSDHSATIFPGLAAATMGAKLIEVHITLSRDMFGPDVKASVTPQELTQLAAGVRFIEIMHRSPVVKHKSAELEDLRAIFTKSVVAAKSMAVGHVITADDVVAKKPGTGIPAKDMSALIGRRLAHAVAVDTVIAWADIENSETK
jgi:N,N'-diacetyllegionaminate synthase